jgi:hypothetical protein
VNSESAGPIGRRLDDTTLVSTASDYQELDALQLGVILAADFDEEGIEIDVDETRGHGGAYTR